MLSGPDSCVSQGRGVQQHAGSAAAFRGAGQCGRRLRPAVVGAVVGAGGGGGSRHGGLAGGAAAVRHRQPRACGLAVDAAGTLSVHGSGAGAMRRRAVDERVSASSWPNDRQAPLSIVCVSSHMFQASECCFLGIRLYQRQSLSCMSIHSRPFQGAAS